MTAALELSRNQITHFYSTEGHRGMLRMLAKLIQEYKHKSRIYLSWDAASWQISKLLHDHVDQHNEAIIRGETTAPTVALASRPWGAQFLNAIDRYIQERNEKFRSTPKRAGATIWRPEREPPRFSEANNCKDPLYYR